MYNGQSVTRMAAGADRFGFVLIGELAKRASSLSPQEFGLAYPWPSLLILGRRDSSVDMTPRPSQERAYRRTLFEDDQVRADPTEAAAYRGRVAILAKREGNPFPNMISIGRAPNNDIVFTVSSMSKMHGYFLVVDGEWRVSDHSSTNGVFVNDDRLPPRDLVALEDGDRLKFGLDIRAQFLLPSSLHSRLRVRSHGPRR